MTASVEFRPGVWVDADQFFVRYGGKHIAVTKSEFAICRLLASRPGHIKSGAAILRVLIPVSERAKESGVRDHVKRLRRKLIAALGVNPIVTHYDEGYSWDGKA